MSRSSRTPPDFRVGLRLGITTNGLKGFRPVFAASNRHAPLFSGLGLALSAAISWASSCLCPVVWFSLFAPLSSFSFFLLPATRHEIAISCRDGRLTAPRATVEK